MKKLLLLLVLLLPIAVFSQINKIKQNSKSAASGKSITTQKSYSPNVEMESNFGMESGDDSGEGCFLLGRLVFDLLDILISTTPDNSQNEVYLQPENENDKQNSEYNESNIEYSDSGNVYLAPNNEYVEPDTSLVESENLNKNNSNWEENTEIPQYEPPVEDINPKVKNEHLDLPDFKSTVFSISGATDGQFHSLNPALNFNLKYISFKAKGYFNLEQIDGLYQHYDNMNFVSQLNLPMPNSILSVGGGGFYDMFSQKVYPLLGLNYKIYTRQRKMTFLFGFQNSDYISDDGFSNPAFKNLNMNTNFLINSSEVDLLLDLGIRYTEYYSYGFTLFNVGFIVRL